MGGGLFECSIDYMRMMTQINAHLRLSTQERKELFDSSNESPMNRALSQQFPVEHMVPVELSA
ncbi:unnamed protein product, partial [Mesorhabditis belari]|uniref:Uncharacterized protein n=1 Tax=Mesorhabditis belari TaxID=2138241 RepID=A0AAF3JC17_9BILA